MINKIKSEISWLLKYLIFFVKNFKYLFHKEKNITFALTPLYDNIGDLGIYMSEIKYFKSITDKHILEITIDLFSKHQKMFKPFIKNDLIIIIGGGFLGTMWFDNEIIIRNIISIYKNNSIIIMPQTMYYDNDNELNKSINIYNKHNDLTICLREDRSFKFALDNFKKAKILYVPDSVLCLDLKLEEKLRKNICVCFRNDKEKVIDNHIIDDVKKVFPNSKIIKSDMIGNCKVTTKNRFKLVINKLNEFNSYEFVITDRLHGMIFSLISNTPVIAFDNKSHKILGIYNKIKDKSSVIFVSNSNDFLTDVIKMKKIISKKYLFDSGTYQKEYQELTTIIRNKLESK